MTPPARSTPAAAATGWSGDCVQAGRCTPWAIGADQRRAVEAAEGPVLTLPRRPSSYIKEVMAVSGSVFSALSLGPQLLRDGAGLVQERPTP